jgi:hypothetical protein
MKRTAGNTVFRIISILVLGMCIGVFWHWLRIFPVPQVSKWRASQKKTLAGRWKETRNISDDYTAVEEQRQMIEKIQSLGYLSGSKPAPIKTKITVYDRKLAYNSLNLIASGHGAEALLITMSGEEVYKWSCDLTEAWPELVTKKQTTNKYWKSKMYWRRVHLMENGDLYAIFEGVGIVKLDKNSNILWRKNNFAHHDLYVAGNGDVYVLTRNVHINKKYNPEKPILEDFITVLDSEGNELKNVSLLDMLENSPFAPVLTRSKPFGDILHTNTIELIENLPSHRSLPFKKGTVLTSVLHLDLVCAVDLEKETVYWAESNLWHKQHQPTLLDNGNMLVFDNQGLKNVSSVLEIDPVTREILWSYRGGKDGAFYSETCGSCQRLPNGNTLITESDPGRAFEVTPDKTIVWEYVNPNRAGKNKELIATLFEVFRLPQDFPVDWMN